MYGSIDNVAPLAMPSGPHGGGDCQGEGGPKCPPVYYRTPKGQLTKREYAWHNCRSCGEPTVMPLKRDGTIGTQGVAWTYGPCPFCGGKR